MAPIIERIGSGCASNPMRVLIRLRASFEKVEDGDTAWQSSINFVMTLPDQMGGHAEKT